MYVSGLSAIGGISYANSLHANSFHAIGEHIPILKWSAVYAFKSDIACGVNQKHSVPLGVQIAAIAVKCFHSGMVIIRKKLYGKSAARLNKTTIQIWFFQRLTVVFRCVVAESYHVPAITFEAISVLRKLFHGHYAHRTANAQIDGQEYGGLLVECRESYGVAFDCADKDIGNTLVYLYWRFFGAAPRKNCREANDADKPQTAHKIKRLNHGKYLKY